MTDTAIDTQVQADTVVEPTTETTTEYVQDAPVKEETVAEVLGDTKNDERKVVGLDKFLKEKAEKKELAERYDALVKSVEQGAPKSEVSKDIAAIGEKFGVDKDFLSELAGAIKADAEKRVEDKLRPFEEKERAEKLDRAFDTHFTTAMSNMPEYEGIVNASVIKTLSLLPQNSNKTFTQIIEEAYGNSIQGKRTIETTRPGGAKEPEPLDVDRARKDTAYFEEIMKDPAQKALYNKSIESRIGF